MAVEAAGLDQEVSTVPGEVVDWASGLPSVVMEGLYFGGTLFSGGYVSNLSRDRSYAKQTTYVL